MDNENTNSVDIDFNSVENAQRNHEIKSTLMALMRLYPTSTKNEVLQYLNITDYEYDYLYKNENWFYLLINEPDKFIKVHLLKAIFGQSISYRYSTWNIKDSARGVEKGIKEDVFNPTAAIMLPALKSLIPEWESGGLGLDNVKNLNIDNMTPEDLMNLQNDLRSFIKQEGDSN